MIFFIFFFRNFAAGILWSFASVHFSPGLTWAQWAGKAFGLIQESSFWVSRLVFQLLRQGCAQVKGEGIVSFTVQVQVFVSWHDVDLCLSSHAGDCSCRLGLCRVWPCLLQPLLCSGWWLWEAQALPGLYMAKYVQFWEGLTIVRNRGEKSEIDW